MFGTFLINPSTAWACGYNRAVCFTSDAGVSWVNRNCGIENGNLDDIWFIAPDNGWVVGQGVYHLGPDYQKVTKSSIIFNSLCVPAIELDTFYLKNFSFFNVINVVASLYGTDVADFALQEPASPNFNVNACDSARIVVRFQPKTLGMKNAKLKLTINSSIVSFEIDLTGYGVSSAARPIDTLLVIDTAYCSVPKIDSVLWRTTNFDEQILRITRSYGSNDINPLGIFPITIPFPEVYTKFSAVRTDTGWAETRFRATLSPCNLDTFITVRAYGISPIINSTGNRILNLLCKNEQLDFIPILNTGNSDLIIPSAIFNPSDSGFSVIGLTSGRAFPDTIKPQNADTLIVKFDPNGYGLFTSRLYVANNDSTLIRGRKNPYIIPYTGFISSTNLVVTDSIFDFGDVCLGDTSYGKFTLTNFGDLSANIQVPFYTKKSLNLILPPRNFPVALRQNDSLVFNFNFTSKSLGIVFDTIKFVATPCKDTLFVLVRANFIKSDAVISPVSISGIVQTNQTLSQKVKIYSTGNDPLTITDIQLDPQRTDWNFTFTPNLPVGIAPGDSLEFNFNFSSNVDTTLKSDIVFSFDAKCSFESKISSDIINHSIWITLSTNAIDFGFKKCVPSTFSDTVVVYNNGSIADTLTRIEILPTGIFSLGTQPNLPMVLSAGDSAIFKVDFNPLTNEGVFSAKMYIGSVNLRNTVFEIPINAEFRKTITSISENIINFGNLEPCDSVRTDIISIRNIGTLADSLSITKATTSPDFETQPNGYIIVPPMDSTQVIIRYLPSITSATGAVSEQISFTSEVCPNQLIVNVSANIIRPMLSFEPNTINFGSVWKDDSSTSFIRIENATPYPKKLDSIRILPDSGLFTYKINLPRVFDSGDTLLFPVSFKASSEGTFNSVMSLFESSVCRDTTAINLSAFVPLESYSALIYFDSVKAKPADSVTFDLTLNTKLPRIKPSEVQFEFSFFQRIFNPSEVLVRNGNQFDRVPFNYSKGKISGTIPLALAENIFQNEGVILKIKGMAFIAYPDTTTIYVDKFEPVLTKTLTIEKKNGFFKLIDFCLPLGKFRIELAPTVSLSIKNEIISESSLVLEISSTDKTEIKYNVFNVLGKAEKSGREEISKGTKPYSINVSDLSSGVYTIVFSTGYSTVTNRFVIYR
ncbi:MAG: T9SS type A sorting domain-containing protein [Bacteroidota bacterium]